MVDGLNRHVMARHEADLAALPPEVRASRTSEEWLATPPLEILRLAREAKATPSQVAPVPGRKGWARRAVEAIAARLRPARDRQSTRLNSSHSCDTRMPASA